jgi:hypothetical protein
MSQCEKCTPTEQILPFLSQYSGYSDTILYSVMICNKCGSRNCTPEQIAHNSKKSIAFYEKARIFSKST